MHNFSDPQLVKLIQTNNDDRAISELFNRYYGKLRQLVSHKVSIASDVDDIVQEVFVRVFTKINQLQDPSKFEIWIYQIVNRHITDHYRSTYSNKDYSLDQDNIPGLEAFLISDSLETIVLDKLESSDIYDIILGFPRDKIKPFLLHHLYNMSYNEIASITEEKASTIRGRIARTKDGLIDEIFDTSTPKEIKTDLALKICHMVSDGAYLEYHLKDDYFQNKLLLEMLEPRRIAISKPKFYFYQSLENIMLLCDINPDMLTCIIKVKTKSAIPILLNRIPIASKVHCVLLNAEYTNYAKEYLKFVTEKMNYSFVASPSSRFKPLCVESVTESSLDDTTTLNYLLEHDPKLNNIIKALNKEYGTPLSRYKFFTTSDPITKEISAYAFFIHTDDHLWELGRALTIDKSTEVQLQHCISTGVSQLLKQKYYVYNSGVMRHDSAFLQVAPSLGFEEVSRFISGTVNLS